MEGILENPVVRNLCYFTWVFICTRNFWGKYLKLEKNIANLWPLWWEYLSKNVDFGPKFWGTQCSISQAFEHNLKCLFKWLCLVKHFLLITGCWPQLYACFRNHELHNLVCLHFKYPLKFGDICLNRSHVRGGHKWILFGNLPRYHVCEEDGDFVAHQSPDYHVCAWEWGDAGRGSCEWLSYFKTVDVGGTCWFSGWVANVWLYSLASWAC